MSCEHCSAVPGHKQSGAKAVGNRLQRETSPTILLLILIPVIYSFLSAVETMPPDSEHVKKAC